MGFNYPLYSVFRTIGGFYYTYIGYNENNNNPYSFIVTHPNLSYINDHRYFLDFSTLSRAF